MKGRMATQYKQKRAHGVFCCTMSDGAFLISVSGQIEYIDILAGAGSSWHCKYEFVAGTDWKIVGGLEAGLSQIANVVVNGDKIVLNLPVEIIYKSTNPYGCKYCICSYYNIYYRAFQNAISC